MPYVYNIGDRKLQVLHTRLRTKCSSLNQHHFVKNVIESPLCQCGHPETTQHFLLQCQRYSDIRHELIDKVSSITCPTVDTLLYGDNSKDLRSNTAIFEAVQKYIKDSQRFERWTLQVICDICLSSTLFTFSHSLSLSPTSYDSFTIHFPNMNSNAHASHLRNIDFVLLHT